MGVSICLGTCPTPGCQRTEGFSHIKWRCGGNYQNETKALVFEELTQRMEALEADQRKIKEKAEAEKKESKSSPSFKLCSE